MMRTGCWRCGDGRVAGHQPTRAARAVGSGEVDRIMESIGAAIVRIRPAWVACCGSIPPGLPADLYAQVAELAHQSGVRFVPDCDGETLRLAAVHADLLSPNLHEAERLIGARITDVRCAGDAARELATIRPRVVAVTLGAEGAVLSDGEVTWFASPPRLDRGSAMGAGDAFLAALLVEIERKAPLDVALRKAVATGAAVLRSTGSDLVSASAGREIYTNVVARTL
jgi:fructose-1-phosphate kinase PfkB-like protein